MPTDGGNDVVKLSESPEEQRAQALNGQDLPQDTVASGSSESAGDSKGLAPDWEDYLAPLAWDDAAIIGKLFPSGRNIKQAEWLQNSVCPALNVTAVWQ